MIIKNKYTNMLVGIMGLLIISCENSTANDSVKPKKTETLELFNKATKEKPFFVTAPFLIIDGKKQFVSPEKYIAAKIKGIKSKYHQVGVPST